MMPSQHSTALVPDGSRNIDVAALPVGTPFLYENQTYVRGLREPGTINTYLCCCIDDGILGRFWHATVVTPSVLSPEGELTMEALWVGEPAPLPN